MRNGFKSISQLQRVRCAADNAAAAAAAVVGALDCSAVCIGLVLVVSVILIAAYFSSLALSNILKGTYIIFFREVTF
jgi:hypothetical protein